MGKKLLRPSTSEAPGSWYHSYQFFRKKPWLLESDLCDTVDFRHGRPLHHEYDGNQYLQGQGFFFLQGEMVRALNPNNPKPETLSENYLAPLASQLLLSWKPPIRQAWLPCCGSLLILGQWGWERWPELDPEKAASNSFSHSVRYIFDSGCVELAGSFTPN